MQYRKFGSLDWEVSVLGFGCMRFPVTGNNPMMGKIIEEDAVNMIRHAIDRGVNYMDTAYVYNNGNSETVLGKALKDGYRDRVKIATKFPMFFVQDADEYDRKLEESLKRLQTDHIDFYLFHALGSNSWDTLKRLDLFKKAEAAKRDGRIKHIGFSFHDRYEVFEDILTGYDKWDFCQLQYNYMDTENQAGTKGLQLAASKGIAAVVMEPLLGGKLANVSREIKASFDEYDPDRTPADWGLQWLWNQPEVTTVLSGMSSLEQVDQNLKAACAARVGSMSEEDLDFIGSIRQKFLSKSSVPCTGCSYCIPCPNGVEIPRNFSMYNDIFIYGTDDIEKPADAEKTDVAEKTDEKPEAPTADGPSSDDKPPMMAPPPMPDCIQCGVCEEKCPQKIKISEIMPQVITRLKSSRPI
ncbi:MAG: aldo/keto reductase [Clostridiales bacterium]|nr:aldo/keto reductase [Clostridiales bacterium]